MWSLWAYFQVKVLVPLAKALQVLVVVITSLIIRQHDYPSQAVVYDGQSFDFVIIGGGAAGCVVANRLTEIGHWTVLLIEAGDDPPYISEIPGKSVLLGTSFPDWNFFTENDGVTSQAVKNQSIRQVMGKLLGGSSSVNFMYYVRGNKADYENWAIDGWDWQTVLRYFIKSERMNSERILNSESRSLHGTDGLLGVTSPVWEKETKKIFEAFKETGHSILEDTNGFDQLGYSSPSFSIYEGQRQSSAFSFIRKVERTNLFVLRNTRARKLILNGKRAVAVEIQEASGNIKVIKASKEIILSAGAVNSPVILMHSGIGPETHLKKVGITTLLNSPNVGSNLQDHMLIPMVFTLNKSSMSVLDNLKILNNTDRFPVPCIMGHVALEKNQTYPDYQTTSFPLPKGSFLSTLMCSTVFGWNDETCFAMANSTDQETLFALIVFLHPRSRGTIRLRSRNPNDNALIFANYRSDKDDLKKYARCVMDFTRVLNATYFKQANSEVVDLNVEQCKGIPFATQEYWECYVLNLLASQYHLVGTCAMGQNGVVDDRLRVNGLKGVRVVDGSVIPQIVSGNTYAPIVMIAEKASDMIKSDNGVNMPLSDKCVNQHEVYRGYEQFSNLKSYSKLHQIPSSSFQYTTYSP